MSTATVEPHPRDYSVLRDSPKKIVNLLRRAQAVGRSVAGNKNAVKSPALGVEVKLDPAIVEHVESVMPLDHATGTLAGQAVSLYGATEFEKQGLEPEAARAKALQIASVLPQIGYNAGLGAEQRDYIDDQTTDPDVLAGRLTTGQQIKTIKLPPTREVDSGIDSLLRIVEVTPDASFERLSELETSSAIRGPEAGVVLTSLAHMAIARQGAVDGTMAAHLVNNIPAHSAHIRLG